MSGVLARVAASAGPMLAQHAVADPGPGRFEAAEPGIGFVLEAVHEGYLMHYGTPRGFDRMDEDLRLLAGDTLYALGLAALAERGDLAAVAELADLISVCARAQAGGRPDVAETAWEASARVLRDGAGEGAAAAAGRDPHGEPRSPSGGPGL